MDQRTGFKDHEKQKRFSKPCLMHTPSYCARRNYLAIISTGKI